MSKKMIAVLLAAMTSTAVMAAENPTDTDFDTDHNGTLSQEEAKAVPGLSEQWKVLDVNADGQLDPAEFSKFEVAGSRASAD